MQRLLLAALAVILAPAMASAEIVIDDFDDTSPIVEIFTNSSPNNPATFTGAEIGSDVGVARTETYALNPDTVFGGMITTTAMVFRGGGLNLYLPALADLTLSFMYDFTGLSDGSLDLTGGGDNAGLQFSGFGTAQPIPLNVILTYIDDSTSLTATTSSSLALPGAAGLGAIPQTFVGFSSFSGLNAEKVTKLEVVATVELGNSLTLASIVATTPEPANMTVPEPASILLAGLLGAGLCGGAARRRKKAMA